MDQSHIFMIGIACVLLGILITCFICSSFSSSRTSQTGPSMGLQCRYTNVSEERYANDDGGDGEGEGFVGNMGYKLDDEFGFNNRKLDDVQARARAQMKIYAQSHKQDQDQGPDLVQGQGQDLGQDLVQELVQGQGPDLVQGPDQVQVQGQEQCQCECQCNCHNKNNNHGEITGIIEPNPQIITGSPLMIGNSDDQVNDGLYLTYPAVHHQQITPISQWSIGRMPPDRDIRVLNDPLYPPLNRMVSSPHYDTFRLIGYLKSSCETERDVGGNTWKLFGRMKDRRAGEFYISPANTTDDIKIPLTSDVILGQRLSDIDTIPSELMFKSPLLNKCHYLFIELPRGHLASTYV